MIILEIHSIGSLMTKAIVRNLINPYVRHITGFLDGGCFFIRATMTSFVQPGRLIKQKASEP